MKPSTTSRGREPTRPPAPGATHPRYHRLVTDDEVINHPALARPLPCRAVRQKIVAQAHLVLAEARAIAAQSDRTLARLSTERPAGCTTAVALVLVLAGTLNAFLGLA